MLNFDFPFCSITDIYEPIYIYTHTHTHTHTHTLTETCAACHKISQALH